ncbi:MAG: hypothetical protein Kow00127_19690 [Bacteroidales bacterium]
MKLSFTLNDLISGGFSAAEESSAFISDSPDLLMDAQLLPEPPEMRIRMIMAYSSALDVARCTSFGKILYLKN